MSSDPKYSYSSIADFKACPLRYYLRYVVALELREDEMQQHHLRFGSAMHEALAIVYSFYKCALPGVDYDLGLCLEHAKSAIREAYPVQLDPSDKAKTQANGIFALEQYVKHWEQEDRKYKVLMVEGPGRTEEFGGGLNTAHLDLVLQSLETGAVHAVDHKFTVKPLGDWYWEKFSPNSQITHYIDYVRERFGRCDGMYINAISLQWRDPIKSNGDSNVEWFDLGDLRANAYSCQEKRLYKGKGGHRDRIAAWGLRVEFQRQLFNRNEAQLQQERESTASWISQIEEMTGRSEFLEMIGGFQWPFDTDSCTWGGMSRRGGCAYRPMCEPGYTWPQDRELIELQFRRVCRQVIMVTCSKCGGNGIDSAWRDEVIWTLQNTWDLMRPGDPLPGQLICGNCKGSGNVPGPLCALDYGHDGPCSEKRQEGRDEVEVEFE